MSEWCLAHPWMTFALAYVLFDSLRVIRVRVVGVRSAGDED